MAPTELHPVVQDILEAQRRAPVASEHLVSSEEVL